MSVVLRIFYRVMSDLLSESEWGGWLIIWIPIVDRMLQCLYVYAPNLLCFFFLFKIWKFISFICMTIVLCERNVTETYVIWIVCIINSSKETYAESGIGSSRSFPEGAAASEDAPKVTRSIMIVRPPQVDVKDSPPVSPAGSTPPVSPFAGKLSWNDVSNLESCSGFYPFGNWMASKGQRLSKEVGGILVI